MRLGFWVDLAKDLFRTQPPGTKVALDQNYTVVEIEGCEYIQVSFLQGFQSGCYAITHKGNCKNPIHKRQVIN